jgi:aldehyde:ferredoxin oxidoreductase
MKEYGYSGKILKINVSNGQSDEIATSDYSEKFLGGKGIATKLFWDMVPPGTGAFDPENCLICATGPVTGFFGLAGCRWVMCGKSPSRQPETFLYGNLGGKWGPALKYAGYDALTVQGQADKPVYLYIHDGIVETKDATKLWGLSAFDSLDGIRAELGKGVSVLTIGPAAENQVVFATALADGGASISGGIGSILGSKKIKAIAVTGDQRPKAAHPGKFQQIKEYLYKIRKSTFGGFSPWAVPGITVPENCYGCGVGCSRQSYKGEKGRRYKLFCQATGIYTQPAMDYYGETNDVPRKATMLCDGYGLDSAVMAPLISWLVNCYREGLITEAETGLPLSKAGSAEFIEMLTRNISLREGFGDLLARGTLSAAETLGEKAKELIPKFIATQNSETRDYDPRLIITTALLYATEPRRPVNQLHGISGNTLISWASWARGLEDSFFTTDDLCTVAERFWGGTKAVDFSTYEGKALAAKKVQDRSCVNESLVLCDVHWPMHVTSADNPTGHVGDPTLESQVYSAITGKETSEEELYQIGERIYNMHRAIQLQHGRNGRDSDQVLDYLFTRPLQQGEVFFDPDGLMPGPDGKIISRLGMVLDRIEFEKMKSDYYHLRHWDVETGFPTRTGLRELGLSDIIGSLENQGLVI